VHEDGSADVIFDEGGHTGLVPADQITWGRAMDGTPDTSTLVLPCPDGCGSTSYHPRESSDPLVQELFSRKDAQ
jgi:hypothetical protein